ncbi:MAG: aminoacyl-tRNA hydrolase [Acaryochloridaceae cyanobacterium CSU_3_4]|nr:aminoacyl-tRNA hydrolase [Acaryochloridaceae cyanobacterium CSU_3_4]
MTHAKPLMTPELIVGLGNPGSKYDRTRHNIGFALIDHLAQGWQISLSLERRFQGEYGEGLGSQGQRVRLLKPHTYMNDSGQSIRAAIDWFKLPPTSVLVIYDEMALPLGKLRLRLQGSAGGHNGMRSIIAHLGTSDIPRLRIGIGSPQASTDGKDGISFVLGRFTPQETPLLPSILNLGRDIVETALKQGIEQAMTLYNGQSVLVPH